MNSSRDIPLNFVGGPFDGEGVLEILAPPGLEIGSIEVEGCEEGFYQRISGGTFEWRLH